MNINIKSIFGSGLSDYLSNNSFLGNTYENYFIALLIFLGLYLGMWFVKVFLLVRLRKLAEKTENQFDDALIDALLAINWPFFFFISLLAGIRHISVVKWIDIVTVYMTIFVFTFYAVKIVKIIIVHGSRTLNKKRGKGENEIEHDDNIAQVFATLIQVFIWIGVFIYALSYAGINVTAALAGVGIGGIAIAFALQNVLSDIFASFAIYFDKPFKKGDFIVIGTDMGTVEKIGIKSTRIKTLQGQELIISNKELTNSRINNFKKLDRRRAVFKLGVTYDTPISKLKKIPEIIKQIYDDVDDADLDRVHFKEFGDSSLNYEIVYYVNAPDYKKYMDIQQKVNFEIKERFDKQKISFAFPTQTIYLEK